MTANLERFGLERDRMRAVLARVVGINGTDLDALEHLEADSPLTQRELGTRLSLTSGAITMLVDRLESAGLAHRRPHPTDRRYFLVELAPQAFEVLPHGLVRFRSAVARLAQQVPAEHQAAVSDFLCGAARAAAEAADEMGA